MEINLMDDQLCIEKPAVNWL